MDIPHELRPFRPLVEQYVQARIQVFAAVFARRAAPHMTPEQVDYLARDTVAAMVQIHEPVAQPMPQQSLRLVLRHDCQSSGCGEANCNLCQYNPSRICKRNLKQKYLIDDHLRAKCGAPLRVEMVDEGGRCLEDNLPDVSLEVHVLNGEKYKEVCPDNTLLTTPQLRQCIIQHNQKKPLLKRDLGGRPGADAMAEEMGRILLKLEAGQAPLSELVCTTSSEALLAGKAPTFRLLVWAVDRHGNHIPSITYVVSEQFVVATKRVKHAIKSDIPSIGDHISKLVHIGKATVDKLVDVRQAAAEENLDFEVPEHLNRVEKVGQFQQLVELTEMNADLKHKLRHLLKLSPEKWEEVTQHALAAVVPDSRPRLWWCGHISSGLLYNCKNGAILMDQPMGLVVRTADGGESVMPLNQLEPKLLQLVPTLKQQALQEWYAPGHQGWSITVGMGGGPSEMELAGMMPAPLPPPPPQPVGTPPPLSMPMSAVANGGVFSAAGGMYGGGGMAGQMQPHSPHAPGGMGGGVPGMPAPPAHPMYSAGGGGQPGTPQAAHVLGQQQQQGMLGGGYGQQQGNGMPAQQQLHQQQAQMQPPPPQQQQQPQPSQQQQAQQLQHQQQQQQQSGSGGGAAGPAGVPGRTKHSPFAGIGLQAGVANQFPAWMAGAAAAGNGAGGGGAGGAAAAGQPQAGGDTKAGGALASMNPSLEMLNTEDLPVIGRDSSLFGFNSLQEMGTLSDLPSVGVGSLLGGGDSASHLLHMPAHIGHGGAPVDMDGNMPADMDRALSLKFQETMSLDLADLPETVS